MRRLQGDPGKQEDCDDSSSPACRCRPIWIVHNCSTPHSWTLSHTVRESKHCWPQVGSAPSHDMLHARLSTPEPITAVTMCAYADIQPPAESKGCSLGLRRRSAWSVKDGQDILKKAPTCMSYLHEQCGRHRRTSPDLRGIQAYLFYEMAPSRHLCKRWKSSGGRARKAAMSLT